MSSLNPTQLHDLGTLTVTTGALMAIGTIVYRFVTRGPNTLSHSNTLSDSNTMQGNTGRNSTHMENSTNNNFDTPQKGQRTNKIQIDSPSHSTPSQTPTSTISFSMDNENSSSHNNNNPHLSTPLRNSNDHNNNSLDVTTTPGSADYSLSPSTQEKLEKERRRTSFQPPTKLKGGLSKIALYSAAGRALEQSRADPLFKDEYADDIAGEYGRKMIKAIAKQLKCSTESLSNYVAIRTKFFDDMVLSCVLNSKDPNFPNPSPIESLEHPITQIVILGAGSDTRSVRLPLPSTVTVFEVDVDEVLVYRDEKINPRIVEAGGEENLISKARVRPVNADVRSDWIKPLTAAGFDPLKPSFFIAESLFMYLSEKSVKKLISEISSVCASHSRVVCDMYNSQYYKHENMRPVLDCWADWGTRPISGNDLPEAYFQTYSLPAKIFQYGQEWAVDYDRIDEAEKEKYLKNNLRGSVNDWPRQWIITAQKS